MMPGTVCELGLNWILHQRNRSFPSAAGVLAEDRGGSDRHIRPC